MRVSSKRERIGGRFGAVLLSPSEASITSLRARAKPSNLALEPRLVAGPDARAPNGDCGDARADPGCKANTARIREAVLRGRGVGANVSERNVQIRTARSA